MATKSHRGAQRRRGLDSNRWLVVLCVRAIAPLATMLVAHWLSLR